jgi:hypothetical protein
MAAAMLSRCLLRPFSLDGLFNSCTAAVVLKEREREGERGREKEGGSETEWRMVEGEMDIYTYIH